MHRKLIFMLAVVVNIISTHGQMTVGLNRDSLKHILSAIPIDSNYVNLLITLGQQYEDHDPDSALYYYAKAGKLSEQLGYPVGLIKYISNYTAVLNVQGKLEESILLNLKAASLSERYGLKRYAGKAYNNIGAVYQYQENYPMAIQYYLKALPLVEQYTDLQSQSLLFTNLCGVYRNMNQADKAIGYARRALARSIEYKDSYSEAKALINMGNCFKDLKEYASAEESYNKARTIALDLQDVNTLETALINLGNIYVDLRQPDLYMPIFYEALPLTDSIEDVSGKAYTLLGICEGLYARQQWQEAESQLAEAILFTRQHHQKEVLRKLYLILSDVLIATQRFNEASEFRTRHDSVDLLLMSESVLKNVQGFEAKYKFEQQQNALLQKDLQLQKSEIENASRKYWLILLLAGVLLLSLLLVLFFLYHRQRQWLHQQALLAMEREKKALRFQSLLEGQQQERIRVSQEIHDDMGSGLTSMLFLSRSLVSDVPSDKITVTKLTGMATSLIEKMNEIVWAMRSEPEPLGDFIVYLRSMAGEMLGNAGIAFEMTILSEVPSALLPSDYRHHIYLIVKEAVHNSIKHSKASAVKLSWDFKEQWKIDIQDDGIGFTNTMKNGHGMKNMRKRANALQGHILVQGDQGVHIVVEFPSPL